ncbi:MAG: aminotransferase class V-fold PLP-dependent enzyme [Deltaproteobacteria bacterium]|nr:MAG: aminotransferase class V-fold PLP-dependent enzyme [Deltaproteobacteria bacterium]
MNQTEAATREYSLDPDDWQAMRALGHRMVDDMMNYLERVRERAVWKPIPERVKTQFRQPLPIDPQGAEQAYQDFLHFVLPHPMGNIHPRFWGWVIGTGTPLGMLAEMLAAGLNPNTGGADHVANHVEVQVLNWCKEMLNYPSEASGLLVSGCSMANLVGLAVARNTKAEFDLRRLGLRASPSRMTLYGSRETHSSIHKAVELLGLGSDALREIPVNGDFQIDVSALKTSISKDRAAGFLPFCLIGNAGTVNTGAIDDLNRLADICDQERLWFHVDGAFGALAALSPQLSPLLEGMERADSLAFDMHKWMYMPYEVGCVLVREKEAHRQTFSLTPDYLSHAERGLAGGKIWFSDYGVQLSRGFRALKAWMSIKEHGIQKYGSLIQQNVDQARYLARLIEASSELQLLAPAPLNIVCFRFAHDSLGEEALNELNKELLMQLHESGVAAPSYTTIDGKYALRVAITNHRSRREDFNILVKEVIDLGEKLVSSQGTTVK